MKKTNLEKILNILEKLDWDVKNDNEIFSIENYSPLGEDLILEFCIKPDKPLENQIINEIMIEYENFGEDEHACEWYKNKDSVRGVPQSLKDLLQDARMIKRMYKSLYNKIKKFESAV